MEYLTELKFVVKEPGITMGTAEGLMCFCLLCYMSNAGKLLPLCKEGEGLSAGREQ